MSGWRTSGWCSKHHPFHGAHELVFVNAVLPVSLFVAVEVPKDLWRRSSSTRRRSSSSSTKEEQEEQEDGGGRRKSVS